jgi:type I site-specific restriction endonuclease
VGDASSRASSIRLLAPAHADNLRGTMSTGDDANRHAAEARARVLIDRQLTDAGWSVQDSRSLNLFAAQGVARREATMAAGHGRADYLLYVDQRVVGVIEAKPEGTPLSGVEWQSATYAEGLPPDVRLAALTKDDRLPFVFEASGIERPRSRSCPRRSGYRPHQSGGHVSSPRP